MIRNPAPMLFQLLTSSILLASLTACGASESMTLDVLNGEARSADGVAIRYDAVGSGEPALVLVHGWMNDRGIWGEHVNTLSRTNRVVALDLGGHGESGANRSEWTMDAFGEDVTAVVEQFEPDRVVLVGFSMGGAAVLEAAERLGDTVLGIVFVDTFHDPDQVMSEEQVARITGAFRANWGDTAFLRSFAYTPDAPASLVQSLKESLGPAPREHWFAIPGYLREWLNSQFKPTLQATEAPVAAINTTRMPTDVEAIRRYAPSFTLDTIAGVGHAGILHQRIEDFDTRLRAIVQRFASGSG